MSLISAGSISLDSTFNAGMSDCAASNQSGTGLNKNADARTSQVPEQWARSGIYLNAPAPD
jgi:hypothetical protein